MAERLTGLDAGYLYMETPSVHMHTLKVAVLDPSGVEGGYHFGRVRSELGERLHLLPPFRRRIVGVPLNLHHPVWIEDPDFDLDAHLHHAGAPAPGGHRELCALISDIAGRPLDRRRPLWGIWMIDGLADGRVAFVAKMHHTLADGAAAAALLANVFDPAPPEAGGWTPEAVPTRSALLRGAAADASRAWARLPGLTWRTVKGLRAARRIRRAHPDVAVGTPLDTPRAPFNGALTPRRTFATATLPLAHVKDVRRAFDVTINDVVLAVCAGAFVRYLDDVPAKPLLAGVPVAVASDGPRLHGNRVSNMFVSLRTDIADPAARLRAIHASAVVAKEVHEALGPETLAEWSEVMPPGPFSVFMRLYSRLRLADHHPPPQNAVISNVAGPAAPLEIAGARLEELYSVGPILEGIGLNITVWSYCGTMYWGLISCPELMPDLWRLASHLPAAMDELRSAAP